MKLLIAFFVICVFSNFQCTLQQPLQVVKFEGTSNKIDIEALNNVLMHDQVKNRKIVVFGIVGESRSSKSFFLNYCLRYMYGNVSKKYHVKEKKTMWTNRKRKGYRRVAPK